MYIPRWLLPDGVTIIARLHGKDILWDSKTGNTLAPSDLRGSSETPAFVAENAERHKRNDYVDLETK